jgi:hypothetical protein
VDKPIFRQALAPSERRPRAELIHVANSYFEGMEAGTDKNTPFDKDRQRVENGVITSNDPTSKSENARDATVGPPKSKDELIKQAEINP